MEHELILSRRRALGLGGAILAASSLAPRSALATSQLVPTGRSRRALRIAHLTDVHVQPEKAAGEGFAAAMAHMQSLPEPPELVLFGGDNVMAVDSAEGAARADVQLDVWRRALRNELSLPHRICIGNHDILRNDATDGKKWAIDAYELPGRYYHFDQAGWRFVVLDSTMPGPGGYKGRLDEEQFEWLAALLRDTPPGVPVLVLSHIPILSAAVFFDGDLAESGDWRIPGGWMHIDAERLKNLLGRRGNVRLCLSGHLHLADQSLYNGTWYCCNGAVSGAWWDGAYHECEAGYAILDLFDDGTFTNEYVTFPWTPRA